MYVCVCLSLCQCSLFLFCMVFIKYLSISGLFPSVLYFVSYAFVLLALLHVSFVFVHVSLHVYEESRITVLHCSVMYNQSIEFLSGYRHSAYLCLCLRLLMALCSMSVQWFMCFYLFLYVVCVCSVDFIGSQRFVLSRLL